MTVITDAFVQDWEFDGKKGQTGKLVVKSFKQNAANPHFASIQKCKPELIEELKKQTFPIIDPVIYYDQYKNIVSVQIK